MKTNNLKRRQRPSQPRLAVGTLPAILTLSRLPLAAILAAVLFLVAVGPNQRGSANGRDAQRPRLPRRA